jgi:hypothetical protein
MPLSDGFRREAERVVRDGREVDSIRATALLLLVGPVKEFPDIAVAAARAKLADEQISSAGAVTTLAVPPSSGS